jgi:hypothetical protein
VKAPWVDAATVCARSTFERTTALERDLARVNDHALTQPWAVLKTMHRERNPIFVEAVCAEENLQVNIGNEHYMLNSSRELMPARKDQPPPDLKHFNRPKN